MIRLLLALVIIGLLGYFATKNGQLSTGETATNPHQTIEQAEQQANETVEAGLQRLKQLDNQLATPKKTTP